MGVLADHFKAQLTEMRARHAETDRELEQLQRECWELLAAVTEAQEALEAAVEDAGAFDDELETMDSV